jgi:hypothetical protein
LYETPVAALAPSPNTSALMSPSGELLTASNSMRALTGSVRASHTPWLCAPFAQSRPISMCHSAPVVTQSGPIAARSNASSKVPTSGGDGGRAADGRVGGVGPGRTGPIEGRGRGARFD